MIVISSSLVISSTSQEEGPNNPVIGWQNLVTVDNIFASSEDVDYPAINMANPITANVQRWKAADDGVQYVEVVVNSIDDIDYIAIARHNLGSQQIPITVEGSDDGGSASGWEELVQESLLANDAPAIFRFVPQGLTNIRLVLGEVPSGGDPAEIAVVYVGKLLVLQRRIYVDHTPINYGRSQRIVNGKSEAGDFLGRLVTAEQNDTAVTMLNLTPNWYRSYMDPFIEASKDTPFFFAWRPEDYPNEVGFCWMTNNPQPKNQRPNGMMQIDLAMTGIAP